MSQAGVNWADIGTLSQAGVNWENLQVLADAGINWSSIEALSKAGINFADLQAMSNAGVNWNDIAVLSQAGVNWDDIQTMSTSGINWDDLAVMTGAGLNWTDASGITHSGINWVGIAQLSGSGVNWTEVGLLGGQITRLMALCNEINDNAGSVVNIATEIRDKVGGKDSKETIADQLNDIQGIMNKVQELTKAINTQSGDTQKIAKSLVDDLVDLANKTAESLGFVESNVAKLTDSQSNRIGDVMGKLDEIVAYLLALKKASESKEGKQEAVVTWWMEMES